MKKPIKELSEGIMRQFLYHNASLSTDMSQILNCFGKASIFVPRGKFEEREFNEKYLCIKDTVDKENPKKRRRILVKNDRLDQFDLTVYLTLIKYMDKNFIYNGSYASIIRDMGLSKDRQNYKRVKASLEALNSAIVKIVEIDEISGRIYKDGNRARPINLGPVSEVIVKRGKNVPDSRFSISLRDFIHTFVNDSGWSFIDMGPRCIPNINQFSLNLQMFISINRCPKNGYWFTVDSFNEKICDGENLRFYEIKDRILSPMMKNKIICFVEDVDVSFRKKQKEKSFCIFWKKSQLGKLVSPKDYMQSFLQEGLEKQLKAKGKN